MVQNPYGKKPLRPSVHLKRVLKRVPFVYSHEVLFVILNDPEWVSEHKLKAMERNFLEKYPNREKTAHRYCDTIRVLRYTLNILN